MCEIELIYLIEAFGALWMLSFDKENQDIMLQNEAVMEALVNSRKSQNKKIEKSCSGALWNMREKLSAIEKYKDLGKLSNCYCFMTCGLEKINLSQQLLFV